jgi:hypothetical protein
MDELEYSSISILMYTIRGQHMQGCERSEESGIRSVLVLKTCEISEIILFLSQKGPLTMRKKPSPETIRKRSHTRHLNWLRQEALKNPTYAAHYQYYIELNEYREELRRRAQTRKQQKEGSGDEEALPPLVPPQPPPRREHSSEPDDPTRRIAAKLLLEEAGDMDLNLGI